MVRLASESGKLRNLIFWMSLHWDIMQRVIVWKIQFISLYSYRTPKIDETKIPKRLLHGRVHSKRPGGKPRKRWEDLIDAHSKELLECQTEEGYLATETIGGGSSFCL